MRKFDRGLEGFSPAPVQQGMKNTNGIVLADTRSGATLTVKIDDNVEIDFDTVTSTFVGGREFIFDDAKDDWFDRPITGETARKMAADAGIRGVAR